MRMFVTNVLRTDGLRIFFFSALQRASGIRVLLIIPFGARLSNFLDITLTKKKKENKPSS